MPQAFLRRGISHPLSRSGVDVGGQTGGTAPGLRHSRILESRSPGNTGGRSRNFRRHLDHRLVDKNCDRVEVGCVRLQAKALGFERNSSATGERIEDRRWVSIGRLEDLLMRFRARYFSSRMFSQTTSRSMMLVQPGSLALLIDSSVGNLSWCDSTGRPRAQAKRTARAAARGRLAHHRWSVEECPCRMLFSRADSSVDHLQRKGNLDQLTPVRHVLPSFAPFASCGFVVHSKPTCGPRHIRTQPAFRSIEQVQPMDPRCDQSACGPRRRTTARSRALGWVPQRCCVAHGRARSGILIVGERCQVARMRCGQTTVFRPAAWVEPRHPPSSRRATVYCRFQRIWF